MSNVYAGLTQLKRAADVQGAEHDSQLLRLLEAASRLIDGFTNRFFIPRTATYLYRWPPYGPYDPVRLWLSRDLLSVTTLQVKAQDSSPTTIAAADYFLEPNDLGPPYSRIEIDLASTSAFESSGATSQRSVSVAGSWGYGNSTVTAGTVASGLASDAAATSMVCSNSALADVGHTLLIGTEQLYVTAKTFAALGSILLNGALAANKAGTTVTVDGSHGVQAGEVVKVDSEYMYVLSVATNTLTVIRAYDGTTLAAHADDAAVHIDRTLTVERGVNGTAAAIHTNSSAMSRYAVPKDVEELCVAEALAAWHQERSGWGRTFGVGTEMREARTPGLDNLRKVVTENYRRMRVAAI